MRNVPLVSGAAAAMIAALVVANPATAASTDSYIVLMDTPPAITLDTGADDVLSGTERDVEQGLAQLEGAEAVAADPEASRTRSYERRLVREQDAALDAVGEAAPVQRFTYALNGFSAILTEDQVDDLATTKGVALVMEDELRQPHTDTSGDYLELTVRRGAYDSGLDGEGVVVGVIDSGIWPEHASFADDGSYERPEGVADDVACDFGQTELPDGSTANDYNPDDTAFDCNNKLLGARDMLTTYNALIGYELYASARDADGHGTHVAGTAAGNADVDAEIFGIDRGTVTGIAPRASVIAYKGLGDLGGFTSDLAGAIDQAVADGVDVINYSIGSTSPSLTGADEIAFLFAANAGVHVATSNGNSGPNPETVGSPSSVPWLTSVGASTHTRSFQNPVQIGTIGAGGFLIQGTSITEGSATAPLVDAEDFDNPLCLPDTPFNGDVSGAIVLCGRGVSARVVKSKAVADAGGVGMILHNQDDTSSLVTDNHFIPSTHVNLTTGLEVKAYIDAAGAAATAKIGVAEKTATQGAVMAAFSSRGPVGLPASSEIIKPDLTAPGVNILAGMTPTPLTDEGGRPGQLFQSISGTSMSSPHVAGLMALIDQKHPDWSPGAVKSALMTTAHQDVTKEDAVTPADPFDMGAGHVRVGRPDRPRSMWQPGIVYDTTFADYLGFLCGTTTDVVLDSTCDTLETSGVATDAASLNYPSIGVAGIAATRTVTRTITNVADQRRTFRARVLEPEGFDVSVSPRRVTLRPGQSATVEITFDNLSATPDVWSYGWLEWRGGAYRARSPIAASGALFDAPDGVVGEGASGSASFDVQFGYTGEYTAAPHGLAPEVLSEDSVGQDPDQSFDPSDEGNGATPIAFDLSDTALFRFTMDQSDVSGPGSDQADLDLFLLDEDGNTVASSTQGATNEQIELLLPEPGTYTMWVHGWQTGGEVLDFTGHSWNIPLTPGTGNLELDSAPDEAVLGVTETIEVSWSGVAPESTAVGAVSHADGDGLLGLTLVTVVNDETATGSTAGERSRADRTQRP